MAFRNIISKKFKREPFVVSTLAYVQKDTGLVDNNQALLGSSSGLQKVAGAWTTASAYTIARVTVKLSKLGAPAFTVGMEIQTDSAGKPSGTVVTTSTTTIVASTLTGAAVAYNFDFNSGALSSGVKYHICLTTTSVGDGSNNVVLEINFNTATGFQISSYNGSGWSLQYGTSQFYFLTYDLE